MSRYKVLPRRMGDVTPEKCPMCRVGWVNFMDLEGDGSLLSCFSCGCVFVSRKVRMGEREGVKEQLLKQDKPESLPGTFKCDVCGKEVGGKLALAGHKRSHEVKEVKIDGG